MRGRRRCYVALVRIGVYVDGFNLYYGARVINPSPSYLAGDLRGNPTDGAGRHWWARLSRADLKNHQLPGPVGPYHRPAGW